MTIEEILAGESKNLEFKVQRPKDSSKYMKSVVAFANGEGGRIVFGVDDKTRQVIGIPKEQVFSEIDAITEAISDSCEPVIIPDAYLQTVDDKTIIIADISEGRQRPYYIKSLGRDAGVYVRVSGTSRPADAYMVKELMFEGASRSFDQMICTGWSVTDEEIDHLCKDMKQQALKNALHKEDVKDVGRSQLLSWGVLTQRDGKYFPTNAFYILTGTGPIHTAMQCGVFKGNTKAVFVDRREYTGPIWEQIDQAYDFVLRNIHLGARIVGIHRQDIYEIPQDSIRELIINAAVHRSYLDHNNIQIAVYDNRLEITSPGKLPMGQTIERMKEGYSRVRNEALANAFSYMNLIEQWGSGIPRIIQEVEDAGLKTPEFIGGEVDLRINIYRNEIKQETNQEKNITNQETNQENSQTDQEKNRTNQDIKQNKDSDFRKMRADNTELVKREISKKPSITQLELQQVTGLSRSGVRYILQKLEDVGALQRIGSTKKGKWVLIQRDEGQA